MQGAPTGEDEDLLTAMTNKMDADKGEEAAKASNIVPTDLQQPTRTPAALQTAAADRADGQKQQLSNKMATATKMQAQAEPATEPFVDDLRRNRLRKLAHRTKLAKELDEQGLSTTFYLRKAQQDLEASARP